MVRKYLVLAPLAVIFCGVPQLAAQAAPGQPPAASNDSAETDVFQRVEDSWSISINHHDQYGLELVLSPLYVGISSRGEISTRDQVVAAMLSVSDKSLDYQSRVITVRMLGDVAVVNGTYTLTHKVNGNPVEEHGVFTHVYQKVRSGWMCVNSQQTQLREIAPAKDKNKSNDGSLFHFPHL